MPLERTGINERNRGLLERLHRNARGPVDAASAASILSIDVPRCRRLLAYLAARGWLARVRRGLYVPVPLGATAPTQWREDPWVVATTVFAPCYIGGWSAGEYWHLTEQIFRDVVVVTASPIRRRSVTIQGTPFLLRHMDASRHFALHAVWRGQTKALVSDPTRTIVDMLDDSRLGGGIRNVAEILRSYFDSEHCDEARLVEYGDRLGNRAVFKRLGYLIEVLKLDVPELLSRCVQRKSAGLSQLDPSVRQPGRVVKRWNLRVNVDIGREGNLS
ncbi:MAG: type IV toxin-antitoxin system AbiEi family antitoxin [Phycisphaerae bacterium]